MKKFLKLFTFGLVLLPCAFVFTACAGENGGSSGKLALDTSGNYVPVTTASYSAFVNEVPVESLEMASYELSGHIGIENNTAHCSSSVDLYSLVTIPKDTKDSQLFLKTNSSISLNDKKIDSENNLYIKDNCVYLSAKSTGMETKMKSTLPANALSSLLTFDGIDFSSSKNIVDMFSTEELANYNITKAVDGTTVKFCFTSKVEGKCTAYMIFDSNILVGASLSINVTAGDSITTLNFQLIPTSKTITFPNFDGYADKSFEEVDKLI